MKRLFYLKHGPFKKRPLVETSKQNLRVRLHGVNLYADFVFSARIPVASSRGELSKHAPCDGHRASQAAFLLP
jgi:hypothetical protein